MAPSQNTDAKLLIYWLFQEGRVLAQDEFPFWRIGHTEHVCQPEGIEDASEETKADAKESLTLQPAMTRPSEQQPAELEL